MWLVCGRETLRHVIVINAYEINTITWSNDGWSIVEMYGVFLAVEWNARFMPYYDTPCVVI